jgi:hypothetical protein
MSVFSNLGTATLNNCTIKGTYWVGSVKDHNTNAQQCSDNLGVYDIFIPNNKLTAVNNSTIGCIRVNNHGHLTVAGTSIIDRIDALALVAGDVTIENGAKVTSLNMDQYSSTHAPTVKIKAGATVSYSIIDEDMKRYSVEQIEERTKNELRPLKARMLEIPAIIDSKNATLAEYRRVDYDAIMREIEAKKSEIEDIDNRILGNGKAIEPILGRRDEILEIINFKTLSLNDSKVVYLAKESAEINALKVKIDEIKRMNATVDTTNLSFERRKADLTARIIRYEAEIARLEARREALINDRDKVKARVFVDETCAYCGQELPLDMQEKARAKFNESRARDLEDIVTRGKNNNLEIERVKASIEDAKNELANIPMPSKKVDTTELEAELARLQSTFVPFENTDDYARLVKEIEDIKATMPEIPTNDNEALTSAKRVLMNSLDELNRRYGLKYKADEIWKEIESLKQELRSVGASIAMLEGKIDKCKEFRQEKADIVSFRVNDKLVGCSIDMWSTQKDGTLIPDVVLKGIDGVKFGSLNFSDQIKVRIEMQRLFMNSVGVELPIFIDEYSVFSDNNRPVIDGQSVCLYATNTPYLTVE